MDGVLLTLHGDAHVERRGVEVRVFRRNFFKYYEKEVFPVTLEQTLAPYIASGGGDLVEIGYQLTVNLTADFAGIDRPQRTAQETERLIAITKKLSEGATMVHSTRDKAELEAEVGAALTALDSEFLQASVVRREALLRAVAAGEIADTESPRDVLTVILQARDELQMDHPQLVREIGFYMQAGAHSTANSVIHALHEIEQWAGDDADRWARLGDPIFVQHCVHESLRLHPASPEAWRTATCPMHVGADDVATGARIELDLFQANRDKSVFGADSEIFDPDRAVPSNVLRSGLTFGIGLHTCLGRELDGGVVAKKGADIESCQFGIVTLIVIRLLALGARTMPDDPPQPDTKTTRPNWGRFPVTFTKV
ncbi:cytochrome P450 [Sphingosinicella microcystinivorans]|nr:cytochrome P450 [Sphingosinicella microcystinivorans]